MPISMMTLGSNLSEGPGEKMDFKPITALFVVRFVHPPGLLPGGMILDCRIYPGLTGDSYLQHVVCHFFG